jgi:hypothetical protein
MEITYITELVDFFTDSLSDIVTVSIMTLFIWLSGCDTRDVEFAGCPVTHHVLGGASHRGAGFVDGRVAFWVEGRGH